MSSIELKNVEGGAAGTVELNSDVFGIEPNVPVMHQVVVAYEASLRQGTHSVKNRHDVSGGGRKPYRQKGTGRARQGSTRAAQWTGGGVVFGPTPRSHAKRANNKEKKLAMRSVLSGKLADNELILLDQLSFDEPSTKKAQAILNALGIAGMPKVEKLYALVGRYVNLAYPLPSGASAAFLDDQKTYFGCQVEGDGGRCFGMIGNGDFLLVSSYGEGGSDPELILYKKR